MMSFITSSILLWAAPLAHQWRTGKRWGGRARQLPSGALASARRPHTRFPSHRIPSKPPRTGVRVLHSRAPIDEWRYCGRCGAHTAIRVPAGDTRERVVCEQCGWVHYLNPKVVCTSVITNAAKTQVLLCRRAIRPSIGLWTLPGGFQELGESTQQAAEREAWEEAHVRIRAGALLAVYDIVVAQQVQLVYRATTLEPTEEKTGGATGNAAAAPLPPSWETLEARWFTWDAVPWEHLAFATVYWALTYARQTLHAPEAALVPQMRCKQVTGPPNSVSTGAATGNMPTDAT